MDFLQQFSPLPRAERPLVQTPWSPDLGVLRLSFVWVIRTLLLYLGPDFSLVLFIVGTSPRLAEGLNPYHACQCLERVSPCGLDPQSGHL